MVAVAALAGAVDRVWVECRSAGGELRSGPWLSMWSTAFESAVPWRGFAAFRGQSSFSGWWWSATMGAHIGYESWLERDNLVVLDFDRRVVGLSSQPFRLSWEDAAGVRRRHVPDFFARLADGSAVVVDVRADERIKARDAEAFEATAAACAQVGWQFWRVGTVEAVWLANVRWLAGYRHPRHAAAVTLGAAREVFGSGLPLVEGAGRLGDPVAVLGGIYHWLWRGELLAADIAGVALSMSTPVIAASSGRESLAVRRVVRWSG